MREGKAAARLGEGSGRQSVACGLCKQIRLIWIEMGLTLAVILSLCSLVDGGGRDVEVLPAAAMRGEGRASSCLVVVRLLKDIAERHEVTGLDALEMRREKKSDPKSAGLEQTSARLMRLKGGALDNCKRLLVSRYAACKDGKASYSPEHQKACVQLMRLQGGEGFNKMEHADLDAIMTRREKQARAQARQTKSKWIGAEPLPRSVMNKVKERKNKEVQDTEKETVRFNQEVSRV